MIAVHAPWLFHALADGAAVRNIATTRMTKQATLLRLLMIPPG
jgi:hypothetical protein